MSELPSLTRRTILVLGPPQGLLLLLVHVLVARGTLNTSEDMVWIVPWFAVAIGVPIALQLVITDLRDRRLWLFGSALAAVLALTGAYAGYAVEPSVDEYGTVTAPYILTTLAGWYVLLPFVQAWLKTRQLRPAYPDLFEFAWNNGITLLIAVIFTGIFWGLLQLWAGLFSVIGIKFFSQVFYSKYFVYPVTATVVAFAISLGRSHVNAVVTVRRIILAVFKGLLPLLAVISLLFLAALPFMGLQPLWATGTATGLMLTLQILVVMFLNAVFQNGQGDPPYSSWLRKLVQAAVVLLPIYVALCAYALYLRINQHGWSTDRFWAVLLVFIVGLHVTGYATAAVRRSGVWMSGMAQVNIAVAAVVVVLSVAVNSPVLDARRISVWSQVGRLLAGDTSIADFDFKYLRFDLGRPGNAALARLKDIVDHPRAQAIRREAASVLSEEDRWTSRLRTVEDAAQVPKHFSVFPKGEPLDEAFIQHAVNTRSEWQLQNCLQPNQRCAVLMVDLNKDRQREYVVFWHGEFGGPSTTLYAKEGEKWRLVGKLAAVEYPQPRSLEELERMLSQGNYSAADSAWQDLRIGGKLQRLQPE